MNDREVLNYWHRRRLNKTLDEHDMRMDSGPPRNVLAALHRENEREEAESAMLPTSRSSSNDGRENAVGTVCTAHHVGGRSAVGSARTVGGRIVSGPPQHSRIDGSVATAASTLLLGVVVEIIPGVSVAGMLAVVGGVDVERVVATMVAMELDVLEDEADRSLLAMPPVKGTALFCWRRIW